MAQLYPSTDPWMPGQFPSLSSNLLNFVPDVKQNHIWALCFVSAHIPYSHSIPTFQRVRDLSLSTSGVDHLLQLSPVLSRVLLATLIFHHASSLADRGLPDITGATVGGLYVRDVSNEDIVDKLSSIDPNTHTLLPRTDSSTEDSSTPRYGQGTVDPHSIKMQGLMALFAIIGLLFVIGGIWFFFWAKNGGFVWRKGDWDDYKSTVLRRKGPDGKTLSNATASTKLGGGSVVGKGYTDDGYSFTEGSYTDTATTVTEEKSRRKKFRETAKEKLLRRNKHEQWEGAEDADVRAYREEKPARIGGMNREADGTYNGSDYDTSAPPTSYQQSEMSQTHDFAYEQPRRQRRDPSGFSFTQGSEDVISQTTEERRVRDPSTRRHNRRRERRSEVAPSAPPSAPSSRTSSPRKQRERRSAPQGHFTEPLDFSSAGSRSEYQYSNVDTEDSGTKSYKHPIPGLTKGYRRDGRSRRRDSLSDSEGETQYS